MTSHTIPLARRRRHALLLHELAHLVAECGAAAASLSRPVAMAPPDAVEVEVDLARCVRLRQTADASLEWARQQDAVRWPTAPAVGGGRSFHDRRVAAEAEAVLGMRDQEAVMPLASVARRVADGWFTDRAAALAVISETAAGGTLTGEVILDEATVVAAVDGLRMLHRVPDGPQELDPALEAERSLRAGAAFALAAVLASCDLD
ncbi:hypothetical protein [Streptomyces chrestomyceticus]|uniref:hypothetical protein n=1 Tax=Streptomyces chrestomyceticus TaxID=68185 RepID=UPI003405AB6E